MEYKNDIKQKNAASTGQDKEEQKRQNAIRFINATQEMIETDGIENISVRKIAQKAGFHNSTIYLYFKDLDELAMLASMKYFRKYNQALDELNKKHALPEDNFICIWDYYMEASLKNAKIFYNFFFGNRSDDLTAFIEGYYEYFPEERKLFSHPIESMYYGKNFTERSMVILLPLIELDTNNITTENAEMINDLIIAYSKYLLEMKCQDPDADDENLRKNFHEAMLYITGIRETK